MAKTDALTRSLLNRLGPVDLDRVIGARVVPSEDGPKNIITLGNKRISDAEAENLKKEAEMLEQTTLYKVFTETLRYEAQRFMFENSKSFDDMMSGKLLLHAISTLEHIVASAKNPLIPKPKRAPKSD